MRIKRFSFVKYYIRNTVYYVQVCRGGEIGRRVRLRCVWAKALGGSSPLPSTTKSRMNLRRRLKTLGGILVITMIVIVLVIIGYFAWPKSQNEIRNELLIATVDNYNLHIVFFDPIKNQILNSRKIFLDSYLSDSSTNSHGSNDSVQFNPRTKEVFFFTKGYSDYDGSCINKDGTCTTRLYKFSLHENEIPTLIFESDNPPRNWIVNSFDDSLLLSFMENKTQTLKKIRAQDGKTIFEKTYQIKEHVSLANFVLSKDGKHIYQASKESVDGKWFYEILRLHTIDNSNGETTEQEIFSGEAIECETDLSPDDNNFAFYSGMRNGTKLYIYEIPTNKLTSVPYQGSISNLNLLWSGDSKKLLYLLKNSLTYYDISTSTSSLVFNRPQQTRYVYAWSPSINYFVYEPQDGSIKVFDLQKNQVIDTQIKERIENGAISWYEAL